MKKYIFFIIITLILSYLIGNVENRFALTKIPYYVYVIPIIILSIFKETFTYVYNEVDIKYYVLGMILYTSSIIIIYSFVNTRLVVDNIITLIAYNSIVGYFLASFINTLSKSDNLFFLLIVVPIISAIYLYTDDINHIIIYGLGR